LKKEELIGLMLVLSIKEERKERKSKRKGNKRGIGKS